MAQRWRQIKKDLNVVPIKTHVITYQDPTEFSGAGDIDEDAIAVCSISGWITYVGDRVIVIRTIRQDPEQSKEFRPTDSGMLIPKGCIIAVADMKINKVLIDEGEPTEE